jgi:hypothetical protein
MAAIAFMHILPEAVYFINDAITGAEKKHAGHMLPQKDT